MEADGMAVVGSTRGPGAAPPGPGVIVVTPHGLGAAGTAPFRPDAAVADPHGPHAPARIHWCGLGA
jgi:hypothetical protein